MRQKLLYSLTLCAMFFFLMSCNNDDTSIQKTTLDYLVQNTWVVENITANPAYDFDLDGNEENDIYSSLQNCAKDNLTAFIIIGNEQLVQVREGDEKCSDEAATLYAEGNWELSNDVLVLKSFGVNNDTLNFSIESISDTELILVQEFEDLVNEKEIKQTTRYIKY